VEVFKQSVDSIDDCTVTFFLLDPTPKFRIRCKREFSLSAYPQTWGVARQKAFAGEDRGVLAILVAGSPDSSCPRRLDPSDPRSS
jgi:hypothetical protein